MEFLFHKIRLSRFLSTFVKFSEKRDLSGLDRFSPFLLRRLFKVVGKDASTRIVCRLARESEIQPRPRKPTDESESHSFPSPDDRHPKFRFLAISHNPTRVRKRVWGDIAEGRIRGEHFRVTSLGLYRCVNGITFGNRQSASVEHEVFFVSFRRIKNKPLILQWKKKDILLTLSERYTVLS